MGNTITGRISHPAGLTLVEKTFLGNHEQFVTLSRLPWELWLEFLENDDIRYRDTCESYTIQYQKAEVQITAADSGKRRDKIACPICGRELEIEVGESARLIENRDNVQAEAHRFEDITGKNKPPHSPPRSSSSSFVRSACSTSE